MDFQKYILTNSIYENQVFRFIIIFDLVIFRYVTEQIWTLYNDELTKTIRYRAWISVWKFIWLHPMQDVRGC